jgi:hypothetical protein
MAPRPKAFTRRELAQRGKAGEQNRQHNELVKQIVSSPISLIGPGRCFKSGSIVGLTMPLFE